MGKPSQAEVMLIARECSLREINMTRSQHTFIEGIHVS